jgi:hypothetical protein
MGFSKLSLIPKAPFWQYFQVLTGWVVLFFLVLHFIRNELLLIEAKKLLWDNGISVLPFIGGFSLIQHAVEVYKLHICFPRIHWIRITVGHLRGVSYTMIGPAILMEFAGKQSMLNNTSERAALLNTVALNRIAQGFPTIVFGCISLFFLSLNPDFSRILDKLIQWNLLDIPMLEPVVWIVVAISLLGIYRIVPLKEIYTLIIDSYHLMLSTNRGLASRLILLSVVRYLVFICQYLLFFLCLGIDYTSLFSLSVFIAFTFFFRMLMPSVGGLQDVAWRALLGLIWTGATGITFTQWSLGVFVIYTSNHLLPTVITLFLGLLRRA